MGGRDEQGGMDCRPQAHLLLHLNAAPEGNVVLDVARGRFRVWVVPGGVRVFLTVNHEAVVARLALPRDNWM